MGFDYKYLRIVCEMIGKGIDGYCVMVTDLFI